MRPKQHEQPRAILGGRTPNVFLREYWQTRPLLVRQGLPTSGLSLSAEELAGLACETDVEARVVIQSSGAWQVRHGPFAEDDFSRLPERGWTLLVQDVDKWLPEVAALWQRFRFLPVWRHDDVMFSYAAPGGGVGPHWDDYDVFLLQLEGHRHWQIARCFDREALAPDSELRLLADFSPEQEWTLGPGDLLYLPPGVAHCGIAVDASLGCSIGFRAPSAGELLTDLAGWLAQRAPAAARLRDPGRRDATHDPGLVDAASLAAVGRMLREACAVEPDELAEWFGAFITEPKPWLRPLPPAAPLERAEFARVLASGSRQLRADPASCLAHARRAEGGQLLFVDGEAYVLPAELYPVARTLCVPSSPVGTASLGSLSEPALDLLYLLYQGGSLLLEPSEDAGT